MANEDAANRATEYWLSLASSGGGGQGELFKIEQSPVQTELELKQIVTTEVSGEAETSTPRRGARLSAG